ncbi:hypothetical protein HMI56_004985 [Coelomomyces lativittatus]|nr:hypothetical protein HMI56_004985 [Coelomomyces lativittatus]
MFQPIRNFILEQPFIACGTFFGVTGITLAIFQQPFRKLLGIQPVVSPPITYPMPQRPRSPPKGYSDEEDQWPACKYDVN